MTQSTCTHGGCDNPHRARGFCHKHYQQWRKELDPADPMPDTPRSQVKKCIVAECERQGVSRGWCTMHYSRWRANGDPLLTKKPSRVPVVDGRKVCSLCKVDQPVGMFTRNAKSSTGLTSHCNECRAHGKRAANYGVTIPQYMEMLTSQDGRCAICGNGPGVNGLAVDHCHATGRVRALLCSPCNSAIGLLREDPEIFAAAVTYLQSH